MPKVGDRERGGDEGRKDGEGHHSQLWRLIVGAETGRAGRLPRGGVSCLPGPAYKALSVLGPSVFLLLMTTALLCRPLLTRLLCASCGLCVH